MRGKFMAVALAAAASLRAGVASAEDAAECQGFPSALDKVSPMRVTGYGPAHFYEAWVDGCERSAEHCQKPSYVLPGDHVLAEDAGAGFFCAWYFNEKGRESWGLLEGHRLSPASADEPSTGDLAAWTGHWRMAGLAAAHAGRADDMSPTGDIAIVADGHGLKAAGDASYPYRDGTGELSANVGAFGEGDQDEDALTPSKIRKQGVRATAAGGRLIAEEEGCRIEMRRLGAFLVVVDNGQCGGMNVTFSGIYSRVGPVVRP